MKKFEAIGVTCKTDITASKKNLVFLKLKTYSKIYIDSTFKKQFSKLEYRVFKLSHIISLSSGNNRGWGKI